MNNTLKEKLETLLDTRRREIKRLRAQYISMCSDLSEEFLNGGPGWRSSSMESEWKILRTKIEDYEDIISELEWLLKGAS